MKLRGSMEDPVSLKGGKQRDAVDERVQSVRGFNEEPFRVCSSMGLGFFLSTQLA